MRRISLLRLLAFGWLMMFSGQGMAKTTESIVINEIMASNAGVVMSPAYNFDGWIELYNPTEGAINLSGMYLSDNAKDLTRWQMPANIGTIPAKGFLVVWLGSDDIMSNHAPFKLDCDGGVIYVSDTNGQLIVSQVYPKAMSRTAWARETDGGDKWSWTASPTPGATNATSIFATERLDAPVVSVGSKIFTGTMRINVEIPAGAKLMYTTDGSVPTSPQATTSQNETGDNESNEPTWTNWITNGDCEGEYDQCFVCKDGDDPNYVYNAITDGVGVNGSRGIKIHSVDNPEHSWDTQFFVYTPDHVWQAGEKYRFRMSIRADKPTMFSVECHSTPGNYINGPMLAGSYDVDENWKDIEYISTVRSEQTYNEGLGNKNLQTIAFTLNNVSEENTFYFDNLSWEVLVEEEKTDSWTNWITNSDCEGEDANCFVSCNGDEGDDVMRITNGVGYNNSRGIKVHAINNPQNPWDTQFFVYTPDHVWKAGEQYKFSMRVRADKAARITMQSHNNPHDWICSNMLCNDFNVTTTWQELTYKGEITAEQAGTSGMNTIAFNLNEENYENNYYFDDIVWESLENGNTNTSYEIVVRENPGKESKTGIFTISNTTNYVFRLFKDGFLPSVPVTRSYIKKDYNFTIPIVSIVGDEKYFYDDEWGIDVVGTNGIPGNGRNDAVNWNQPWDRPVNFSFISPEGEMLFNQDVMTSVSGGWSRMDSPRSLKLKSNKIFDGLNHLDYAFFPQKPYIRSKALLVRNGGNDGVSRFKDPAMTTIVQRSGIDIDVQSTVQVAEYINGEFRGILNLREPNNDKFVYANWGYDDEEIDAFENFRFNNGTDEAWNHLLELSERIDGNNFPDEIKTLLDIDEFTNYMAAELYLGNSDWPNNNVKGYRSQNDGRFRFVLFDLDQIFNYYCDMKSISTLSTQFANEPLVILFRNLLRNNEYRKKFIDTFCIMGGSVFESDRITAMVNEIADAMRPMQQLEGRRPDNSANDIKNRMLTRFDDALSQLQEYEPAQIGSLKKQTVTLNADTDGAHIFLNDMDLPYADFKGYLFQPVKLEAKAPAGYRFVGWSTGAGTASNCLIANTDTWKYYDKGEAASNWNTNGYNDNTWASGQAPLGYKMTGVKTTVSYGSDSNQKNPTTYFRKTVSLSSAPSKNDKFLLNYQVDDGFIVYVNGKEAGRFNMPSGVIGFEDFSSSYASDTPLTGSLDLSPSLFNSGNNLIAVEIHNNSYTSSDQFWAAELYTSVGTSSEGFISTEPVMDLPTGSTVSLTATFTKLSEEELVAQSISPLRVNEVSAANSVYVNEWFKHNDWFELYNTTDTNLDIAGLYISDDEDNPLKYQIPANNGVISTIIPAGGHRIIWADELDPVTQLHTNFKLKNDDDQMVLICSSDEFVANNTTFFEKHPEMKSFADGITYVTHRGDQTIGRYPDGGTSFYKMYRPTIEQPNAKTSADTYLGEDTGMTDPNQNEFTLALAEGWNWMSHPMADPIATSKLSDYTNRIVGSDSETIRDQKSGMVGTLKELETGNLYKVQMQQADTYTSKGLFCEDGRPIMLQPGWNWIGYTVNGAQTLSAALSDFLAEDGDKIISHGQGALATYENGAWQGSLTSLETGMGYMFYTKQAKTMAFKSPSVKVNFSRLHRASHNRASRSRTRSPFQPVSKNAYPNVMGVIAEIWQNNEKAENDRFTLFAYDANDECRGEGKWVNGLAWLTLYGKGGEPLTYRAIDQWDGTVYNIRETISFTEGVTGSVGQPYIFTIGEKIGEINAIDNIPVTPSSDIVGYYNLDGTRVSATTVRRGIYLVKYNNGSYKKIIVK